MTRPLLDQIVNKNWSLSKNEEKPETISGSPCASDSHSDKIKINNFLINDPRVNFENNFLIK